jgi:hypothetical protein
MPYTKFGETYNSVDRAFGYEPVTDELIFEDGATAHSAGYDGTQGWIIRSNGTIDAWGDMTIGGTVTVEGNIYLSGTGEIATSSAAPRVLLAAGQTNPYIELLSGKAYETNSAFIELTPDDVNDALALRIFGATDVDSMLGDTHSVEINTGNHPTNPGIHLNMSAYPIWLDAITTRLSGLLVWESDVDTGYEYVSDGVLGVKIANTTRLQFAPFGLYTDYSKNAFPRVWRVVGGGHSHAGAGAYESDASLFNKNLGTAKPVSLTFHAFFQVRNTASATSRGARVRLRWSTDGGSTWTNGDVYRVDGLSTAKQQYATLVAEGGIDNVTPTGNVQVEMQMYISHADVVFGKSTLHVTGVGDM